MADVPDWWKNLTDEGRETYIRVHPRSEMAKHLNQEARDRIAANKEERAKLRSGIKKIGKNPEKVLKKDFEKFDNPKKISKHREAQLDSALKQSKRGNKKGTLRAIGIALAVAGVATIGAGVLASGGLPYLIITHRLIKDVKSAGKEIHEKISDGAPALAATLSTVKEKVKDALSDPKMVAAALMLAQRKKKDPEKQTVHSPNMKKKDVKHQGKVEKKEKKHDSNKITELAPKKNKHKSRIRK